MHMVRTQAKVLITMMRPNRNGNRKHRVVLMTKNPKNRDHGRLLQNCEKAQGGRQSGDGLV